MILKLLNVILESNEINGKNMKGKVTILGAGAFGTSIATILANNGYKVFLWSYEPDLVDQINLEHENKIYFSGFKLDKNIIATNSLEEALYGSDIIFQAIPVKFIKKIFQKAKSFIQPNQMIISLSKGIENLTYMFPSQIIDEILEQKNEIAVISGPTFAKEIAAEKLTASVIAAKDKASFNRIANLLNNDYFKTEYSGDLIGVQAASALKNVVSLSIGISRGFGLSNNTIAYFFTKGFEELSELVKFFGGKKLTAYGLSGLGDLYLSSTSSLGRNFSLGKKIGMNLKTGSFDKELFFKDDILPESINSIISLNDFIVKNNLELNYLSIPYKLIFANKEFSGLLK